MLPLLAATYFMVSGGPYGLEEIIGDAGYGWALIILFVRVAWALIRPSRPVKSNPRTEPTVAKDRL